ncbi:MAG: transglutaminase domain-containing protein [Oscillospiraceae bacterium]|nr:transglutaminase domain-containing protein [Oscillospiraceae bacterium]
MRRIIPFLLALLLGLTGCHSLLKSEHLSVSPHVEASIPSSQGEIANTPPVVSERMELRGAVLSFIRDWTEQGLIYVQRYNGDIAADLDETIRYATQEDPIGAYAVDYIDAELSGDETEGEVAMSIVFRRSAAEIDAIVTVNGNSSANEKILQALKSFDVSLTLRIRNYQEEDFTQLIYRYCLDNPGIVPVFPTLSAQVYPKEGASRILELHFAYPVSKEELRVIQSEVQTIMNSASSYVRSGKDERERAQLLCRFLSTRFSYAPSDSFPQMPAYELLSQGKAHSFSFASVFYAQCLSAGLECRIVSGSRAGADHYWNLLQLDDKYYHVDLLRSMELGQTELLLLSSQELLEEEYSWQAELYPAAVAVPETDETQPEESTESGAHDHDTTAPSESTESTEESVTETAADSSESGSEESETEPSTDGSSESTAPIS